MFPTKWRTQDVPWPLRPAWRLPGSKRTRRLVRRQQLRYACLSLCIFSLLQGLCFLGFFHFYFVFFMSLVIPSSFFVYLCCHMAHFKIDLSRFAHCVLSHSADMIHHFAAYTSRAAVGQNERLLRIVVLGVLCISIHYTTHRHVPNESRNCLSNQHCTWFTFKYNFPDSGTPSHKPLRGSRLTTKLGCVLNCVTTKVA